MAPNFQSSFIPKEPAAQEVFKKKKTGIVGSLIVTLFVISIFSAAGLYAYKIFLNRDVQSLKAELVRSEEGIDKETIKELSDFNEKLKASELLIFKHAVLSNFLNTLASSTVSSVRFTGLDYKFVGSDALSVDLTGEATGYAAVALQENVFSADPNFRSVMFSDLKLADGGLVAFNLSISVDPQMSVYAPNI